MLSVESLEGPFGVQVSGVDLAYDKDPATIKQLVGLLHSHHVIVIRNQRLSLAEYSAFGRHWGDPIIFFRESHRNKEFPELIEIHNSPDTPLEMRDYARFWHTDSAYEKLPASVTLLNALEAPNVGGETLFVDMAAAYDALPQERRAALDGIHVEHRMGAGNRQADETKPADKYLKLTEEEARRVEPPVHPLVIKHPVTGRRALYAVAGTCYGIVGMSHQAGEKLLADLKQHATQERFRLKVKAYASDILIWDNLATMHTATKLEYSDEDGKRRKMMRISVTGLPPEFRQ